MLRLGLQVTAREINADRIAVNALQRTVRVQFTATGFQRHNQFDFIMKIARGGRIGDATSTWHDGIGRLAEEHWRARFRIAPHLLDVVTIVLANAVNPPDRKSQIRVLNSNLRDHDRVKQ